MHHISATLLFRISTCLCLTLLCWSASLNAEDLPAISYQGRLKAVGGQHINGVRDMTVALYSSDVGTAPVWVETHSGVQVTNGLFTLQLGTVQDLTNSHLDGERWLGITVSGDSSELPRTRILAVPYARIASHAQTAASATSARYAEGELLQRLLRLESQLSIVGSKPDWAKEQGTDENGVWADLEVTANGKTVLQRFRYVSGGTYLRGSLGDEVGRESDESRHTVEIETGFWFADTECTQGMWQAIMDNNPSFFPVSDDHPVEQVQFAEVQAFITALNGITTNTNARLPTEAEWELACRAFTTTLYSVSTASVDTINCKPVDTDPYIQTGTFRNTTVSVKALPPNPWGIYGLHGNVWEWCQDWYGPYPNGTVTDPTGPETGTDRVSRGGGFDDPGNDCRTANRSRSKPTERNGDLGFRLVIPGEF